MENLGNFFSLIGEEKKKEKEKTKEIVGEVSLGDLFTSLGEEKKKVKEKSLEKEKELEKIKKDAKIFEAFLFNEAAKVEKDTQKEVKVLEKGLLNLKNPSYKSIDRLMRGICKKYGITPLQLHNQFKKKHNAIPDEWIKLQKEEVDTSNWKDIYKPSDVESVDIITPQPLQPSEGLGSRLVSKEETSIDKSLQILDQLVTEEEKINESETEIARLKREMDQLRKMVNETARVASVQGGGGEVRLQYLDDINFSGITSGSLLLYDGPSKKWVGIASNSLQVPDTLDEVLNKGNTSDTGMSVGFVTATSAFFSGNVSVAGTLTATAFSGDGSGLTNVGMDTSNVSVNTLVVSGVSTLGVVTGATYYGDGSNLIGVANTANVTSNTLVVVGVATFFGNVTIGGTLAYEDVTDIDSVGIITANNGVNIVGGGLQVVGITTINSDLRGSGTVNILGINSVTATSFHGDGSGLTNVGMDTSNVSANTLVVSGVSTVGVVTGATSIQATTYYGDGSNLTGINAGAGGTANVSSRTIQSGIITAVDQFYPPSLTSVERDGLSFNVGAFIFNETENKLQMYLGGQWKNLAFELDTYSVVGL